ncbi:alpha/beta fold hydrolase [Halovulum dunhuangense]|uniref:Alpha/beta fold hydrolase n=1 Tax=Halovulum dunhuangense TaxID=1505036 RepID=A0A849KW09_9RHOB|nr:alpha/beta fold hydrolase BchO [Halovulum dunhuangense]NNU79335.1 alpha/beta fold hydrolase [Halovulum dunhuangense]
MDWAKDGGDWPNRQLSRMVPAPGLRWHVQRGGSGPRLLLLHGAGASSHSWRDLIPLLLPHAEILAPDLPGHGFSKLSPSGRSGLPQMAEDVAQLLRQEDFAPDLIVGHSAGAAIALRLAADGLKVPRILGLNAALMPFQGLAGLLFPPLAKLLVLNPLTAPVFARTASRPGAVRSLIEGTGSRIDARGLALYQRLISDSRHVEGTLRMMARWDLAPLIAALPSIATQTLFGIGLRDRAVPPETTIAQARRMPAARLIRYPDLGHLMHEEAPELFAAIILSFLGGREEGEVAGAASE